jgi:hydrogenase/urease accessory protein HupE
MNEDVRFQHGTMSCPGGIGGRELRIAGLELTQTDVLLRVDYLDGSASNRRLTPVEPSVVIPARPSALDVVRTYTVLGVGHILGGVDHLLFVLALLLLVRGIGRLVATVTAFTLAHSVTLAAATLGFVHVPSAPVEATIALSILFLASELARQRLGAASPAAGTPTQAGVDARADLTARFPWLVAFSFGLLHGFGFAGALSEVGVPQKAVPLALFFFNVGVEIGQLLFIAIVLALGWALRRAALRAPAWWPRAAAYGIGSVAAFWLVQRTAAIF